MPPAALLSVLLLAGPAFGATLPIDVRERGPWQDLAFRRIPPNAVDFSSAGVRISVDRSASPLLRPLAPPVKVRGVRVRLRLGGPLSPERGSWDEDSRFRLGLVVSGEKRLDPFAKALAPSWVRTLHSLAPEGGGVSRIVFLMLGRPPSRVGDRRIHPASDLIEERIAWLDDGVPGERRLEAVLEPPLDAVALWLSVDGDATGSRYDVLVESLELVTAEEAR